MTKTPESCEYCAVRGCEGDCPLGLKALRAANARIALVSHRDTPNPDAKDK